MAKCNLGEVKIKTMWAAVFFMEAHLGRGRTTLMAGLDLSTVLVPKICCAFTCVSICKAFTLPFLPLLLWCKYQFIFTKFSFSMQKCVVAAHRVAMDFYTDFHSLVAKLSKTHSSATLTHLLSKVLQLTNQNLYVALSMKLSIWVNGQV